ncbi:MAG: polysaccharide deacetylase family protein [Campylobacterota bacterium]|nr:polysaccharide deacetylase family protein [Campylobacterota bacterium]
MHNNTTNSGIFTISLDFELYWGMRDCVSLNNYSKNLDGVHNAITTLLKLFKEYNIHATWAPVGFLYFPNDKELKQNIPNIRPNYTNANLSPYTYIETRDLTKYHFAPNLLKKISTCKNQELGSHTFSHFYCLEDGQTESEFETDLRCAMDITKKELGIEVKSLIFPRNQHNYLSLLAKYEICYRGTQEHWIYKAVKEKENTLYKRGFKLLDSYINLTGHHTYTLKKVLDTKPYNIAASHFLRSQNNYPDFLQKMQLNRIMKAMDYAAKNCEVYHLWWHPHNFGVNTKSNIDFLETILRHYQHLQQTYKMRSLNMGEISSLISQESSLGHQDL